LKRNVKVRSTLVVVGKESIEIWEVASSFSLVRINRKADTKLVSPFEVVTKERYALEGVGE
jgi:hypothetical protein